MQVCFELAAFLRNLPHYCLVRQSKQGSHIVKAVSDGKAVSDDLHNAGVLRAGSVPAQPPSSCGRLVRQSDQESQIVKAVSAGKAVSDDLHNAGVLRAGNVSAQPSLLLLCKAGSQFQGFRQVRQSVMTFISQ